MTDRDKIIEALRNVAPNFPVNRIWGRTVGSDPDQGWEGNSWAADVDDVADIILTALERTDG